MDEVSVRKAVVEAIEELTGSSSKTISDAHDLVEDLRIDSMASVSLLIAIEDRVGKRVPEGAESDLVGVRTVGDLVERLTRVFAVGLGTMPTPHHLT
jgi:acyl carrier protein